MSNISNDAEFKKALQKLDPVRQRVVAALFVQHVLPLANDLRLARVIKAAVDPQAAASDLADALKSAKAATLDSHARCGSEGNWTDQAGYFVARAAVSAVTPEAQARAGGAAWQAAMSCRMAQTSMQIDNPDAAPAGYAWQYEILSNYLKS